MHDPTLITWLILYGCAMLIGLTKAGFGGGTGLLITPLLAMMSENVKTEALGLMLPLLFATDVFAMFYYWRRWDTKNVIRLVPGALIGILIGSFILQNMNELHLKKAIGFIALGFGILQITRDQILKTDHIYRPAWWHGLGAGMGIGITSTLAHIGGPITLMFLLPQKLPNRAFVGTTTALFFCVNLAKFPPYIVQGMFTRATLFQDLMLLPMILIGVLAGIFLNRRVSSRWFTRIILALVIITGLRLVFW